MSQTKRQARAMSVMRKEENPNVWLLTFLEENRKSRFDHPFKRAQEKEEEWDEHVFYIPLCIFGILAPRKKKRLGAKECLKLQSLNLMVSYFHILHEDFLSAETVERSPSTNVYTSIIETTHFDMWNIGCSFTCTGRSLVAKWSNFKQTRSPLCRKSFPFKVLSLHECSTNGW